MAAGELAFGKIAFEGLSLSLSLDDISAGFFANGKSSLLTEAGISPSVISALKGANDARAFVTGLRGIIKGAIDNPNTKMSGETWDQLNLVNDQLMLLEDGMQAAEGKK